MITHQETAVNVPCRWVFSFHLYQRFDSVCRVQSHLFMEIRDAAANEKSSNAPVLRRRSQNDLVSMATTKVDAAVLQTVTLNKIDFVLCTSWN